MKVAIACDHAAFHLKELWHYMLGLFDGHETLARRLEER